MLGLKISIRHCSEQHFLDSFRGDLANGDEQVIILSPFLSQNRALYYYPVLQALINKQVTVDVYARPKSGQPESLRAHFEQVERNLQRIGVHLYLRPGMHEKVGVIDGRILWHGSLNILSHNDTKESMLRFESPELVQEILRDLGIYPTLEQADSGQKKTQESSSDEAPSADVLKCPICDKNMRLFEQTGLWICQNSPSCPGTLPVSATQVTETLMENDGPIQPLELQCPLCDSPMMIKRWLFTRVTCSSPDCDFALERRLAASILRILKRGKTP